MSPEDGAAGVAVNTNVTGTFSEAMDAATINATTVALRSAAGAAVTATVTYDAPSRTVTLDPTADLAASTTYTASISTGVKDANGNALATAKTWSFATAAATGGGGGTTETITVEALEDSYVSSGATTTDYGSATVLEVDGSPIKISYLKFDLGLHAGKTITAAKLQLRATNGSSGSQRVKLSDDNWTESAIRYNSRPLPGALVGTLTGPTSAATYSVTLDTDAVAAELGQQLSLALDSSSGDGLDFASSENTTPENRPKLILTLGGEGSGGGDNTAPTVTAVSPEDGAAGVAVNTNVTGTFSEAMDAATINATTVALRNAAGAAVTATVTYDAPSRTVTLDPTADLAASTTYTASISTGVKDANGNALATAKTWSFATAAATGGGGGTTETITVEALEDSYVSSGATTTDYGSATVLEVDGSPIKISYLKFDLGLHAGKTITAAKLQLRATNGSSGSQRVKLSDDNWTESAIRYNSRPLPGALVGTLTGPTSAATYSVTLDTDAVAAELGQQLSLALDSSSGDGLDFASSENTTPENRPKLILTVTSP
ncbi:Ig-like domain-containing protein [Arthrobacter sp. SD76]|uniref:Ig-like domain-containing protein n=1 Tax=Arthrobacter sp. SD76 TaxID=3415007 RepID=UPI003C7316D7